MNKKVSVIIVHYGSEEILQNCVSSIIAKSNASLHEIIIVDNNDERISSKWLKKSKKIRYFKTDRNLGYGSGNNFGAEKSSSDLLFFLNPDTLFINDVLFKLKKNFSSNATIIAPLLVDQEGKAYRLQGTSTLTPLRAIFALSIINRIWPDNPIANKYWLLGKNKDRTKKFEVDVVPGTAFMIKKSDFNQLHGFDEDFFLYFEEPDFCKRFKEDLQGKLFIEPEAQLFHEWEASTGLIPKHQRLKFFWASQRLYFTKHYGRLIATVVSFIVRFSLANLLLLFFLLGVTFVLLRY